MKMKRHITAVLTISSIILASCGGSKELPIVDDSIEPRNKINLDWQTNNAEYRYIYEQSFKLAQSKLRNSQTPVRTVFIDVAFLLYDQNLTYSYLSQLKDPEELNLIELNDFCKGKLEPTALNFLRQCQADNIEIILLSPENQSEGILSILTNEGVVALPSMMEEEIIYGRNANNFTLNQYFMEQRLGMVLTTSIGELRSIFPTDRDNHLVLSEIEKAFGDQLILFPNPAFN